MTKEGVSFNFVTTPEGLHEFDVDRKTDGCMFGKHIIGKKTRCGSAMCYFMRGRNEDATQPSGKNKVQFAGVTCDE